MTQLEEDLYDILKTDTTPIIERAQMLHIFFVQMLKHGINKPSMDFVSYAEKNDIVMNSLCNIAAYTIRYDSCLDLQKQDRITHTVEKSKWIRLSDAKFFLKYCNDEVDVDNSIGSCFLHEYMKDTSIMQEEILYFLYSFLHYISKNFEGDLQMMSIYGKKWYQKEK